MASILKSLGAGLQNVGGAIAGAGSSNTGGAVGTGSSGTGTSAGGAVSGSGSGTSCASTTQEQQQQQQQQHHQQQQKQQQPSQETWPVSHDAARQRFAIALPLAAAPSTGLAGGIAGLGMGTKPAPQAWRACARARTAPWLCASTTSTGT